MSVEDVTAKVQRILIDRFGSADMVDTNRFRTQYESALGFVDVQAWGEDSTVVKVWSPMLRSVPLTPEVFKWVATDGQNHWFAHARIIASGDDPTEGMIAWEYDILGDFLDPDELKFVMVAVVAGANEFDDELQDRFGGLKAND